MQILIEDPHRDMKPYFDETAQKLGFHIDF